MSITRRQEQILQSLIQSYLDMAEPVSSGFLKKKTGLNISPATIRNELQELTDLGFVAQPHTSAGRVPTEKGYRYFISITFSGETQEFPKSILREIETTKHRIDRELEMAKHLTDSLENISQMLEFKRIEEDMLFDILKMIGPSQKTHEKNIDVMKKLLEEFENL